MLRCHTAVHKSLPRAANVSQASTSLHTIASLNRYRRGGSDKGVKKARKTYSDGERNLCYGEEGAEEGAPNRPWQGED